jgi:hypothetical protein
MTVSSAFEIDERLSSSFADFGGIHEQKKVGFLEQVA